MGVRRFFKEKSWIIAIFIFILAFSLRLLASLKIAWRPDEIVYIDRIGNWFSEHFFAYFFQFYHKIYPPDSDIFGNPPLGMWFLTIGIWVSKIFGFSALLGARIINVILGSLTAVLLFYLGKKWYSKVVGIIAGFSFALLPLAIANNATAYLETPLVLLVTVALEFAFRYFETKRGLYLYLLGIILGLSFLTKFISLPLILGFLIAIPVFSSRKRPFWRYYFLFILITILTPVILWSGLRDPQHITGIYWEYKYKMFVHFEIKFPVPVFRYYYLMLFGILPPIIILGTLIKIITLIKNIIKEKWKNYFKEITIVGLVIIYLAYNSIFTRYGGAHQILPIIPLISILAALGLNQIIKFIIPRWAKILTTVVVLACLALPLFLLKAQFWGLYANSLVGGTNNAFKLYNSGLGGEGVPQIAKYLNENTPEDSRTAIMAYDWLLPKYLKSRTATSLFQNEGIAGAMARGADYLVLPRPFEQGEIGKTLKELFKINPIYTISERGVVLAKIYKVDYSNIKLNEELKIGAKENWEIRRRNNVSDFKIENGQLQIDYLFSREFKETEEEDSRILMINQNLFSPSEQKGLYFELYGDGNVKILTVFLTQPDKSALTYFFIYDWRDWKKIYIPFDQFIWWPSDPARKKPDLNQKFILSFEFLSKKPMEGKVILKNIHKASLNYP